MYYMTYFVPEMHFGFLLNNLWDQQTKDEYGMAVRTTDYYALHCERIRKIVPGSRLLDFQAADGWEPLCKLLGREVPDCRYPHRNDSRAANQLMKSFAVYGVGIWVVVAFCGWVLVWSIQRMLSI